MKDNPQVREVNADGIRAKMCDLISDEFKQLIKEQIDPWFFFNSKGIHIKKFDGKDISISGCKFGDSSMLVFWSGYIEPYIEDVIKRMIEETIKLANDKNVPVSAVLESTKANLSSGIDNVYHKMREVDRRLRGNGFPDSVPKRDVSFEVKQMNNVLDKQAKIYEDLAYQKIDSWFINWYRKNPHWVWVIGTIIAIIGVIIAICG